MKTLLLVGRDKIGAALVSQLPQNHTLFLAWDGSSNVRRALRLVRRGSLRASVLVKMAWAEWQRPAVRFQSLPLVQVNADVLRMAQDQRIERMMMFRAGLIIDKRVLGLGIPVFNIHCARLPDYGGIGAIARALGEGALEQEATLHHVTDAIDRGQVIDTEPYRLDPAQPYRHNEDIAYEAGIRLALRWIMSPDAAVSRPPQDPR
jgi:methionyl-tRNA formyltransferase